MASTILTEALATSLPPGPALNLPAPDMHGRAHMERVQAYIADRIDTQGFLPFDRFMDLALHAPGLGYYAAGAAKFGAGGDFVTAPELSPLFGHCLARQIAELIDLGCTRIIELGAGTGRMAADILTELERLDRLPSRYEIVELSAELRERQAATMNERAARLARTVAWLDELPQATDTVIIGNEVLDALPVSLIRVQEDEILELGVQMSPDRQRFVWTARPAAGALRDAALALALPDGYTTEIHLAAQALVRTLAERLVRGAVIFIDYGFPVSEYYHPQRSAGTLMCHYRHHAHPDPLCLPGLQDITAHLDFSALARIASASGFDILGYTQQARFLMNCGLLEALSTLDPQDVARYAPACAAVQKLLSPAEMGELFKVIAFGRDIAAPLLGFRSGVRSGLL